MYVRAPLVAALLFVSGACALIYQMAWLRELRLVFGASTPASAAVVAVFMAGLGWGSISLGARVERSDRPLRTYAWLEAGIAIGAAVSPLLLTGVRAGYVAVGGSTSLGTVGGTIVRLLLSAIVLLPPTFLMGGTLPAAARAVTSRADLGRSRAALLYGCNTIGALTGAFGATFVLLEVFGNRFTLWIGCALNALVAVVARMLDRLEHERVTATASPASPAAPPEAPTEGPAPTATPLVLVASAVVGFVFMAMELVWYRVLAPLLGGSTYTFGLILAVALGGIGAGGIIYARRPASSRPTLGALAISCVLEALLIGLPFALGDRVALLALVLQPLAAFGLWSQVLGWSAVCAIVVLPASIVAGYQFPLLIALLGSGSHRVARQVGLAYAFNTIGSIGGSLAGGFLLVPGLGALGAWRYAVTTLVLLGLVAGAEQLRQRFSLRALATSLAGGGAAAAVALALVFAATGPTAVWRHSPIGAGRSEDLLRDSSPNGLRAALEERRAAVSWQRDGRESSVALYTANDTSFLVNGKSDGAAVLDGGTQVMGGLLGALLHPGEIRRALVIGLGTGSTAGWLGKLPGVERVDVVELEPAILEVARACSTVNQDVLSNPKVHVIIGDAREVLLTTPERYDLVFSEPSNPYRSGIASLFTQEFYQAARARLRPDGLFVQWLQAYEIDARAIRIAYTTLASVFPTIDSWRTKDADLMLVAGAADRALHVPTLRERVATEPFRSALMAVWRVHTVEGVLAHYVARPAVARAIADYVGRGAINTDDRNQLEFAFPRALGGGGTFQVNELRRAAAKRSAQWPELAGLGEPDGGPLDWELVHDSLVAAPMAEAEDPELPPEVTLDAGGLARYRALAAWRADEPAKVIAAWESQPLEPRTAIETMVMADAYAVEGREEQCLPLVEQLASWVPVEAAAITARLHWAQRRHADCQAALTAAVEAYRTDPWASNTLMARTLPLAYALAARDRRLVAPMNELLRPKLNVDSLTYLTRSLRLDLSQLSPDPAACVEVILEHGPHVPWYRAFLEQRIECFRRAKYAGLADAEAALAEFLAQDRAELAVLLPSPPSGATAKATAAAAAPSASASASAASASASVAAPSAPPTGSASAVSTASASSVDPKASSER